MIYIVSDIHGYIRLDWLKTNLEELPIIQGDYLLILGDAGIVWDLEKYREVRDYYEGLPCLTLFLDGNHENFDLLDKYPVIEAFSGRVGKISDKIFHLRRGEIYTLLGKRFFVFGGGFSLKKLTNTSPVFVWDREMPSDDEYENGKMILKENDFQIDYVLTHVAPTKFLDAISAPPLSEERKLNDYLDEIDNRTVCKHWFFGHYHKDIDLDKFSCVYERVIQIGD